MILDWELDVKIDPTLLSLMQAAADCAILTEGITKKCAVHVRICDDTAIHEINREYRQVDRATDVLSFPMINYPKSITAGTAGKLLNEAYDDEFNAIMLGDIIISVDHIYQQAQEYGHSPSREAAYLLVHGLCHLMGYDHIEEDEKRVMRKMEERILSTIGMQRDSASLISDEALLNLALAAREKSYSPYSHFAVGAALLCENGRVFQGCNVENASLGLTNCAERTAVFKAISEGEHHFKAIAIAGSGAAPWPCGACRQVLNEFAPDLRVLITWDGNQAEASLRELLPHGFGPEDTACFNT